MKATHLTPTLPNYRTAKPCRLARAAQGLLAALSLSALVGCGSDDDEAAGTGQVSFNVYGEEFIEDQIPADEFEDGWSVTYDKFLIVVGDIRVAQTGKTGGASIGETWLVNLASAGPHELASTGQIPAQAYDLVSYRIPNYAAATTLHASASSTDQALMQTGGLSVYASGSATSGSMFKTFNWSFTNPTHYRECVQVDDSGSDLRQGIVLANGGVEPVQLTIHGDHLFYDDLAAENAVLRFDAIANADANGDDEVTREELAAVQLFDLSVGSYGAGSASGINTLDDFIEAQIATLGHFRGEGHCQARSE